MSDKKDYFSGLPDDPNLGIHFLAFSSGAEPGPEANFLHSVDQANMEAVVTELDSGMPINSASPTGLTALHIAVARDNVPLARLLIERGAKPGPDALGRWQSMIAGLCEVSEEMCDLIADAEEEDRSPADAASPQSEIVKGIVKFWNPMKGYGFIEPAEGGKDVFVTLATLREVGITSLQQGQSVDMTVKAGDRPEATTLRLS